MRTRVHELGIRAAGVVGWCLCVTTLAEAAATTYERTAEQLKHAVDVHYGLTNQMAPYDAVFRRDPMQPLIDEQGQLVSSTGLHGGFFVQGIIWSDERPLAVIDDELVAQGATVGPYTILKIQPDSVVAQRGSDTLVIPLDRGLESPPPPTAQPTPAAQPTPPSLPSAYPD